MKPKIPGERIRYLYYSDDGGVSLSDLNGILIKLGFTIDACGRHSDIGPTGRFIDVVVKDEE